MKKRGPERGNNPPKVTQSSDERELGFASLQGLFPRRAVLLFQKIVQHDFTYVIGFIFSVNTYVLSNSYVPSTRQTSLEITVGSLMPRWEVLEHPVQIM